MFSITKFRVARKPVFRNAQTSLSNVIAKILKFSVQIIKRRANTIGGCVGLSCLHEATSGFMAASIYEPRHEISNNVVCATSKGSDQTAHKRSLIRAFASRLNIL